MKAGDIMSPRVISVTPDASIQDAIQLMLDKRISGLPVIDSSGTLVGVVTEGDFLRRAETGTERKRSRWLEILLGPQRLADEYVREHGRKVEDVMTRDPVTVDELAPLDEVVRVMERRRIKRLPVVRGTQVVGHCEPCQSAACAREPRARRACAGKIRQRDPRAAACRVPQRGLGAGRSH